MTVPGQMTSQLLNLVKNSLVNPYHLNFAAKLSANVTLNPVPPGTVAHLNSVGEYELGVDATQMGIFLFPSSTDPDIMIDGGNVATEAGAFVSVFPPSKTSGGGAVLGLVAVGAYELSSTRFDTEEDYEPNDTLTATTSNSTGGLLTLGTVYTDAICGVVSRGVANNGYGHDALFFWPVYVPTVS